MAHLHLRAKLWDRVCEIVFVRECNQERVATGSSSERMNEFGDWRIEKKLLDEAPTNKQAHVMVEFAIIIVLRGAPRS